MDTRLSLIFSLFHVVLITAFPNEKFVKEFSVDKEHYRLKDSNLGQIYPNPEYSFIDVDDINVKDASRYATDALNHGRNSLYRLGLWKIVEAGTRVVTGLEYKMTLQLQVTTCQNTFENFSASLKKCPFKDNEKMETCKVVVWDRMWLKPRYRLTDFSCSQEFFIKTDEKLCPMQDFRDFKMKYNKYYETKDEEENRYGIFCANMKKAQWYQEMDQGTAVYGATQFADLSEEEFRAYLTPPWNLRANDNMKKASIPNIKLPESFDWREKNAVTPVKNQGQCGSCWAFSTTGNIEGQYAIKNKKLISLSEQELVDCDKVDQGCGGGLPSNAYKVIMKLGGLESEKAYPYEASDDKCVFNKAKVAVKINGSLSISKNENDMAAWLVKNGPISIGINAFAMQFYFGGISHPFWIFCRPSHLDHGVLIVGFGTHNGEPYWIIKNSWGPGWGEQGYYKIYRGDGSCGLNNMCTSATVP